MMNKLTMIKQAVSEHFAAKEARSQAYINDPSSLETQRANYDYNPSQDAAMLMLQSLIPLLEASVILGGDNTHSVDELWDTDKILEAEVAKLLAEVDDRSAE